MHHYGEDAVSAEVTYDGFRIELENHVTGARIVVSGPLHGVFQDPDQPMDEDSAMRIGSEFAHLMRVVTGESTGEPGPTASA